MLRGLRTLRVVVGRRWLCSGGGAADVPPPPPPRFSRPAKLLLGAAGVVGAAYAFGPVSVGPVVWNRKAALTDAIRAGDAVTVSRLLRAAYDYDCHVSVLEEALSSGTLRDPVVLKVVAEEAGYALKDAVLRYDSFWSWYKMESVVEELFSNPLFVNKVTERYPKQPRLACGNLLRSRGFRAALERLVIADDGNSLMQLWTFAQEFAAASASAQEDERDAQPVFTQEMLTELARCAVTHDRFDALSALRHLAEGMPGFVPAVLPHAARLESARAVVILLGGRYSRDIHNVRYRDAGHLLDMVKRELLARPGDGPTYRAARALTQHGDNLPFGFDVRWCWRTTNSAAVAMALAYREASHETLLTRVRGLLKAAHTAPHSDVCKPLESSAEWDKFMGAGPQAWGPAPLAFALQWAAHGAWTPDSRKPERMKWVLAATAGKQMDAGVLAEAVVRRVREMCRAGKWTATDTEEHMTATDLEGVVALVDAAFARGQDWKQLAAVALVAATVCLGEGHYYSCTPPQQAVKFIVDLASALRVPLDIKDNAVLAALATTVQIHAGGPWWDQVAQGILEAMR